MANQRLPHDPHCIVSGCESHPRAKGLCMRHYLRWHRYGDESINHPLGNGRLMQSNSTRPEYTVWEKMIDRCENPKAKDFMRYGGRGIVVCAKWRNSFTAFFEDMGARPSPQHSIERGDNNGNYEPENCRWATRREQGRNTSRNRLLEYNGRTACLAEWAETTGLPAYVIRGRLKADWSVARTLTTPKESRQPRQRGQQ